MYYKYILYECQYDGNIINYRKVVQRCGKMEDRFVVRPKKTDKKEDKSVVMTLRMDKELQEEFDILSAKSDRSRNELMCRALRYALEHLEFIPESAEEE